MHSLHSLNGTVVSREASGPYVGTISSLVPAQQWSESEVLRWLDSVGESDCKGSFANVTGSALLLLDNDALEHMGIERLGQRKRLTRKIGELRDKTGDGAAANVNVLRTKSAPHVGRLPAIHSASPTPMLSAWTDADVVRWLELNELGEHRRAFAEHKVTGGQLLGFGEEQLVKLGISKLGHRKRLMRLIEDFRVQNSPHSLSP